MHTLKTLLVSACLLVGTGCVSDAFAGYGYGYDPLAQRVEVAENRLDAARHDVAKLTDARHGLLGQKADLAEQIEDLRCRIEELDKVIARHRLEGDPARDGQLRAIENALAEEQRDLGRLQEQALADLQRSNAYRRTLDELTDARRRLADVRDARWSTRADVDNARRLVDLLERDLAELEAAAIAGDRRIALVESRLSSLERDREHRLAALEWLARPPAHLLQACDRLKAQLASTQSAFDGTCNQLAAVERDLNRAQDGLRVAQIEYAQARDALAYRPQVIVRDRVVIDAHIGGGFKHDRRDYGHKNYGHKDHGRPVIVTERHRPVIVREHSRPVVIRENPRVTPPAGIRPGFRDADNADSFRRVHDANFQRSERMRNNTAPTRAGNSGGVDRGERYR
ncbi:MAG: hypothetical protein ACFCVE_01005 [Phycisphaerae bacterium]